MQGLSMVLPAQSTGLPLDYLVPITAYYVVPLDYHYIHYKDHPRGQPISRHSNALVQWPIVTIPTYPGLLLILFEVAVRS
ncbi:hypothetical protein F5B19DRAFT_315612 [Rostrohypoxylon terebratum]|nr:hypothetical protein F5B19DRAFT_315612 [Rostrohypoxylon terebratum]